MDTFVASTQKNGFVWVDLMPVLIVGDIQCYAELNDVKPAWVGSFWSGQKGHKGTVGHRAKPGEKVVFHLHDGSFVMGSGHSYQYLIHDIGFEPHNIVLCGDSAGGISVYHLLRYTLTYNLPELLPARGLLLLSTGADSSLRVILGSMVDNGCSDLVHNFIHSAYSVRAMLGSLPEDEVNNSWFSLGSDMISDDNIKGLFIHHSLQHLFWREKLR
ncbi:hypothetical protein C8J56DRAFT_880030 [Mycena floridula]|nr:hypothetical protein C8J56DRAFT_880030 [Mycena floridula]